MKIRTGLLIVPILAQTAIAAYCPPPEPGSTSFDYGKAFVHFLEIAAQSHTREVSMLDRLQVAQDQPSSRGGVLEFSSIAIFSLKLENADLECAERLIEAFLPSKSKGIEASASSTRTWVVASIVSDERLISDLKAQLPGQEHSDLGGLIDKVTDFMVRSDALSTQLGTLAALTSYAFVDLSGDADSKTDTLSITATEKAELLSMLRKSFPQSQTVPKGGLLAPDAAAFLLQKFLNDPRLKPAASRRD